MIIAVVATHAHPLPSKAHTGDSQVILDLTRSLCELGHETWLFAPHGTEAHDLVQVQECDAGDDYERQVCEELDALGHMFDVVHDFTIGKAPSRHCRDNLLRGCKVPYVSTLLGGHWEEPLPNTIVWSRSMRDRVMRGASDYEGTATPDAGGAPRKPFKDVRVVHGGIDFETYCPGHTKEDWYLWMNRWHPVKGYRQALEFARSNPSIELVLAGEHPDRDHLYQAACARDALERARDLKNVRVQWLQADPKHHAHKIDLYQRARALLYPVQFHEPFGLSMVEAMACETPVLGLDMGSVSEVVGFSGGFVRKTMDELALVDPGEKENTRGYAVEKFDRFVMARKYIAAYRDVIEGRGWG